MNFLRSLDLYKGLILVCGLLLPVAYLWVHSLQSKIYDCEQAITAATRTGGLLEEIGALQKARETIEGSTGVVDDHKTYFDRQIIAAFRNGISSTDFNVSPVREFNGKVGRTEFTDNEVTIEFGGRGAARTESVYSRANIAAVLYNCESGATTDRSTRSMGAIWKLRELDIANATEEKALNTQRTPPIELEDRWQIKTMKFVRREPRKR